MGCSAGGVADGVVRVKITRREFAELVLAGVPLAAVGASREEAERFLAEEKKRGVEVKVKRRPHPLEPGCSLSLLGYGGIRLPVERKRNDRKATGYWEDEKVDIELGCKFVDYAYSSGINYFDTGYLYHGGDSERLFGRALSRYPRSSFYLCDKMPTPHIKSLEHAKEVFKEQLDRCKVKYFDTYMLHEIRNVSDWEVKYKAWGVLDYLKEEKKRGRIRHLGFSFHERPPLFSRMLQEEKFECALILLNAIDWEGPNQSHELCKIAAEHKLPLWVMEPLLGGRLAHLKPKANAILHRHAAGKTDASWALRFAASEPQVACVLSSFSRIEHLKENILTLGADFKPMSGDEHSVYAAAIAEELSGQKLVPCTECRYCMPCPYGIDIAGLFKWWNDKVKWACTPSLDKGASGLARWDFLSEYRSRFPGRSGAYYCIGCKKCDAACPQWQFVIPDELEKISSFMEAVRAASPDYPSHLDPSSLQYRALRFLKRKGLS